jgi:hypothetical protein
MSDPHRDITHQLEKAEVNLYHDNPTRAEINKARFHVLDAIDILAGEFKKIEPRLIHNQTK